MSGVVNVGGGESRGGECRTILKSDTRAGAAQTPGHAASVTFENKMRGAAELCRAEGLAFVPRLCAASPLVIHFSHLPLY